ncbi:MAG: helix-turn-helix transcriptional regulator [Eubacteriales bacterium]|jgi:transcriptional regulator with XRE-family HTH domain|nr:helix-turn-helix transcriptional regulator [Eubacteriales bacterium]
MKFGDKLKIARNAKKLKQADLAKLVGVSSRTIQNYETADMYPKNRDIYYKLAEVLEVDVNYLLSEGEDFITEAQNKYGYRGRRDAVRLVEEISGLFAGGSIPEEDKDAIMRAIQDAYWDAKEENKKYIPKKYRNE